MSDLISRDDAIRALNGSCSNWEDDAKVAEIINALPSAEAVQGVRCKDCRHYIVEGITTRYGWCHEYKHSVDEDDYCSYGERKK